MDANDLARYSKRHPRTPRCAQPSRCDDPKCPGWVLDASGTIQRCDDCSRFYADASARVHVKGCPRCRKLAKTYRAALLAGAE